VPLEDALETVLLALDEEGLAVCTFHRPEARNALNAQMVRDVRSALERCAERDDVRVLLFTGAGGKAFVSGADVAELRERRRDDAFRRINTQLLREIEAFPRPTIAAIEGFALGGGLELAMACDLRVCGQGARLGQPEVGLGILPGAGGMYRLPRLIGLGRARELVLTGRIVGADEALAIGLVNRVAADGAALDEARALAREIAKHSPLAVRLAKLGMNVVAEMSTDAAMAFESTAQAVLFEDDEKDRRMATFLARRKGKPS
jgi:enoyl-CoA hydratase